MEVDDIIALAVCIWAMIILTVIAGVLVAIIRWMIKEGL